MKPSVLTQPPARLPLTLPGPDPGTDPIAPPIIPMPAPTGAGHPRGGSSLPGLRGGGSPTVPVPAVGLEVGAGAAEPPVGLGWGDAGAHT